MVLYFVLCKLNTAVTAKVGQHGTQILLRLINEALTHKGGVMDLLAAITPLMWFLAVGGAVGGTWMGGSCKGDAAQRAGGAFIGAVLGFIAGAAIGFLLPFVLEALPGRGN